MKQFQLFIVLYCLANIKGERSIYGIFHLLQGKSSSQTIQDAKLFGLEPFFQAIPDLTKKRLEDTVSELTSSGCICMTNKDTYILTNKGFFYLEMYTKKFPLPNYLNGWRYRKSAPVFWHRFSLTVQTLSCLVHEHYPFIPVINDDETQAWVKRYLMTIQNRFAYFQQLYCECTDLLNKLPSLHADIFVLHLSGFHRVGYTLEQISLMVKLDRDYTSVLFQSILHFMIENIEKYPNQFSELKHFLEVEKNQLSTLTLSSQKTYQLLLQNKSIHEIALIRNLKMSTIEDHIVEIASELDDFKIDPFISLDLYEKILRNVETLETKRLKPIRDALDQRVSFFQIRLVLGRMGK